MIARSSKTSPAKVPPIMTAKFLSILFPRITVEDLIVTGALSVVMVLYGSSLLCGSLVAWMMLSGLSVVVTSSGSSVIMTSSVPLVEGTKTATF